MSGKHVSQIDCICRNRIIDEVMIYLDMLYWIMMYWISCNDYGRLMFTQYFYSTLNLNLELSEKVF